MHAPDEIVGCYTVARCAPTSAAYRLRYQADVIVSVDATWEQVCAALAAAARQTLRVHPSAKAALVAAFGGRAELDGTARGRAWISRDGRGWTGLGTFPTSEADDADDGQIHLEAVDAAGQPCTLRVPRGDLG